MQKYRHILSSAFTCLFSLLIFRVSDTYCAPSLRQEDYPVKVVADSRFVVSTPKGNGEIPIYLSADLDTMNPAIRRAIIVVHGHSRDADVYWHSIVDARGGADIASHEVLLVVPQFLADVDIEANNLKNTVLHWHRGRWMDGDDAKGPASISSFEVIDAIINRLGDRQLFPNLTTIIIAGHSAGGQLVQRYSVVGDGEESLQGKGIGVRYVIANPSSYLYFGEERPFPTLACPSVNRWKYGWVNAPEYATHLSPTAYENRFFGREVDYLLGSADTNPNHPMLDKTCAGEAQGPYRFARGQSYFQYLLKRHPGLSSQQVLIVPGVGHNGDAMLNSTCGLYALFDQPGCVKAP